MKVDIYTKIILTVIAVALFCIAFSRPSTSIAQAAPQGAAMDRIKFAVTEDNVVFFDPDTGEVSAYEIKNSGQRAFYWKLRKMTDQSIFPR